MNNSICFNKEKIDLESSTNTLSSSVKLGVYTLPNRIVMAPMSCLRDRYDLSSSEIVDYYVNKASAGLIVSDPTLISPLEGFSNCPGIYSHWQVERWRDVTKAVRDCDSKIFLQLWYCEDKKTHCQIGESLHINSLAIDTDFSTVAKLFRRAAQNALAADFDGVEIHAPFSYADEHHFKQSLKFSRNLERQIDLLSLIVEEIASVWDEDRVGIRITPEATLNDLKQSELSDYLYNLFDMFNFYDLAYVHLVQPIDVRGINRKMFSLVTSILRCVYEGKVISSCQNDFQKAKDAIADGRVDLVSFNDLIAC